MVFLRLPYRFLLVLQMLDVLIADDEQLARETLKFLLSRCDGIANVYEASDGRAALELALQYQPGIVMLDIEMPNIDGIEVANQLPDHISIIFVTAFSHLNTCTSSAKPAGYLLKPFKDEEFFRCVEEARIAQAELVTRMRSIPPVHDTP